MSRDASSRLSAISEDNRSFAVGLLDETDDRLDETVGFLDETVETGFKNENSIKNETVCKEATVANDVVVRAVESVESIDVVRRSGGRKTAKRSTGKEPATSKSFKETETVKIESLKEKKSGKHGTLKERLDGEYGMPNDTETGKYGSLCGKDTVGMKSLSDRNTHGTGKTDRQSDRGSKIRRESITSINDPVRSTNRERKSQSGSFGEPGCRSDSPRQNGSRGSQGERGRGGGRGGDGGGGESFQHRDSEAWNRRQDWIEQKLKEINAQFERNFNQDR